MVSAYILLWMWHFQERTEEPELTFILIWKFCFWETWMPRDLGINNGSSCWASWPLTMGLHKGLGPESLPDQLKWFSYMVLLPGHPWMLDTTGDWSLSPMLHFSWSPTYPFYVYPAIVYQLQDLTLWARSCACLQDGEIGQGLRRKESTEFYFSLNYSYAYKEIVWNNCSMALNLVNKTPLRL